MSGEPRNKLVKDKRVVIYMYVSIMKPGYTSKRNSTLRKPQGPSFSVSLFFKGTGLGINENL